jgi:hypothetical protein
MERLSDLLFQDLVDLARFRKPFGDASRGISDQTNAVAPLVLEICAGLLQLGVARSFGADVLQLFHRRTHVVRAPTELRDQLSERLKFDLVIAGHCRRTPPMMLYVNMQALRNGMSSFTSDMPQLPSPSDAHEFFT